MAIQTFVYAVAQNKKPSSLRSASFEKLLFVETVRLDSSELLTHFDIKG